jgi:hypothetical protein
MNYFKLMTHLASLEEVRLKFKEKYQSNVDNFSTRKKQHQFFRAKEPPMKLRMIRVLIALTFIFTWLGFHSAPAYAASCYNVTCEGLDPNTMGCGADAVTSGSAKILSDGGNNQSFVETRKSAACDAKWARTTNKSGGYRYAAASLRYGCTDYCYNQSVRSPGTIANLATVYTSMHAYVATPTRSCGAVSVSGPISIPLPISSGSCTSAN